jgi:hypothetical protein
MEGRTREIPRLQSLSIFRRKPFPASHIPMNVIGSHLTDAGCPRRSRLAGRGAQGERLRMRRHAEAADVHQQQSGWLSSPGHYPASSCAQQETLLADDAPWQPAKTTSVPPQSEHQILVERFSRGGRNMKRIFAAAVIAVSFTPLGVLAQERAGDAALGAVSGAIVLRPVGAVAGAVVGYTAGPVVARSWGLRRSERATKRSTTTTSHKAALVQGASAHGVVPRPGSATQPPATEAAAKEVSAPPAKPSAGTIGTWNAPPVQGLE